MLPKKEQATISNLTPTTSSGREFLWPRHICWPEDTDHHCGTC